MRVVSSIQTGHPLDLAHLGNLLTQQIRKNPSVHPRGAVLAVSPVVLLKDFGGISRYSVGYQHYGLVAGGIGATMTTVIVFLQQLEGCVVGQS